MTRATDMAETRSRNSPVLRAMILLSLAAYLLIVGPFEVMGRVMSVMMMGSVGLVPVLMLIAGAAVQVSLDVMLVVAGIGMAVLCLGSLLSPTVRRLGFVPQYQAPDMECGEASASGFASEPART
ncbi:MAG TPA: hypothetical protein VMQ65_08385 [Candidatus Limnocylindria bacterium]|nr:hypothetical protein [Candidatus Limnocylindria bacterium]